MEIQVRDLKMIKFSLMIIAAVVVMFVLRLFSFIFIPLFLALFIALLLLPLLDWFSRKKVPNWLAIVFIVLISSLLIFFSIKLFQNTATELYQSKGDIMQSANDKINPLLQNIRNYLGMHSPDDPKGLIVDVEHYLEKNSGKLLNRLGSFITGFFMTIFFLSLFLTGAHLFEVYIARVSDDDKNIIQIFRNIVDTLNGFIKVKLFVSLLTGIAFAVIAMSFGIKFAFFWGFMAFILNFVQLIGSYIITIVLILFGFVEIDALPTLLFFSSLLILTQVVIGGILEPILMGKSFKINTITILISLAIWGFIFGIAGLVLAIPITVFLKMILERIPSTAYIAKMMSRVN
jgi:predicted PurR-regulated permease PerM